jgi:hypothetical protein
LRIPKSVKRILTNLAVLGVVTAIGVGLFLGRDRYQIPDESPSIVPAPVPTESSAMPLLLKMGKQGTCSFGLIYMSLPPKCRTADGGFIQASAGSPFVMKVPGVK